MTSGTLVEAEPEFEPGEPSEPTTTAARWWDQLITAVVVLSRPAASSGLKQSRAGTEAPC